MGKLRPQQRDGPRYKRCRNTRSSKRERWAFSAQAQLDDTRAELDRQRAVARQARAEEQDEIAALIRRVEGLENQVSDAVSELEQRARDDAGEVRDAVEGALDDLQEELGGP